MTGTPAFPTIFVSHGPPTLLIEPGPTHRFLQALGETLSRPRAIVCISAHWETAEPVVTAAPFPPTIHDFYGFPQQLYEIVYEVPGDPDLARRIVNLLGQSGITAALDPSRGLDHGAWVPLKLMYPEADIPVVQLSVQTDLPAEHHLKIGRTLQVLREDGVLILGSGNATHNLSAIQWQNDAVQPPEWVQVFVNWLFKAITEGKQSELIDYKSRAPEALKNHPTPEHFLPLFVPMGAIAENTHGQVLHDTISFQVLSMAAFAWHESMKY